MSKTNRFPDTSPGTLPHPRVMIVSDGDEMVAGMAQTMNRHGMTAICVSNGSDAVSTAPEFNPDVVLVDLELPDIDGLQLIRWFNSECNCGVIAVSQSADAMDLVISLEVGADDFAMNPPPMRELLARIRALHRRLWRAPLSPCPKDEPNTVVVGPLQIDIPGRAIRDSYGQTIHLTEAEFAAIRLLALSSGSPVSRDTISKIALGRPWRAEDRGVDQLIFGLRRKLPGGDESGSLIHSVRGFGYVLRSPQPFSHLREFLESPDIHPLQHVDCAVAA